jgi:non-ribosomal peptide synthetase component F
MVLVSIWAILLKHYSGDNDINIGTPTANRAYSQIEQLVGFFVNSLVLRFTFEDEITFKDVLLNTRQVILDALAHQDLPFEKLVEVLKPPRAFNYNPIFQVMFAWQNTPRPPLDLEGITSERMQINDCVAALDITFYMWEVGNIIEGEIEFSVDIISRETIKKMKDDFLKLIPFFINNPAAKITDVSL